MRTGGVYGLCACTILWGLLSAAGLSQAQSPAQTDTFGGQKDWTWWSAVVTGSVFCDQCIQGRVFPFSYPLDGAKVTVQCKDAYGRVVDSAQGSTNFLGDFLITFKGKEDLSGCQAILSGSPEAKCNIVGGGGRTMTLKSKLFFQALYVVDPLFYKPAQPAGICPKSSTPSPPSIVVPFPNRHPSTCSTYDWLHIDYFCWWPKTMSPFRTTVGRVFGRLAQKKYGNMNLLSALECSDPLLREATAALLNSYTNRHFYMSSRRVVRDFNIALRGSPAVTANQAQAFHAANSGFGKGKCLLVPCKL